MNRDQNETRNGIIVKWNQERYFGFIKDVNNKDIFFHGSCVLKNQYIESTAMLNFDIEHNDYYVKYKISFDESRQKYQAYDVSIIALAKKADNPITLTFDEDQLRMLFGNDSAESEEDEPFSQYYFKSEFYYNMKSNNAFTILAGHKGVGKTALFKMLIIDDTKEARIPISIKPEDIKLYISTDTQFESKIMSWKYCLYNAIIDKLIEISETELDLVGLDLAAALAVGLQKSRVQEEYRVSSKNKITPSMFKKVITSKELSNHYITVYIDDLDREWKNTPERTESLNALLNAIFDISNDYRNIRFRVALRSNVYYSVRVSNETSDKIDSCVRWMDWEQDEIVRILVKRVWRFFYKNDISDFDGVFSKEFNQLVLGKVFENEFRGTGKWEGAPFEQVLISLVRGRPRDMIKLCKMAGQEAHHSNHSKIDTFDLTNIFLNYSNDRLRDAEQEFRSEFNDIRQVMLYLKPTVKEINTRTNPFVLTKNEMLEKMESYIQTHDMSQSNYKVDASDLCNTLYRIGFVSGRKEKDRHFTRINFRANEYITSIFANYDFDFEIAPAYRFALMPELIRDYSKAFLGPELEGVRQYLRREQLLKERQEQLPKLNGRTDA